MSRISRLVPAAVIASIAAFPSQAAINYTTPASTITEDFDTLPTTGGSTVWANDSTLPGWSLFRQPAAGPVAITAIAIGTGSSTTGSFYSFGTASATDRSLGGLGSGGAYFGSPATGAVAGWIAVAVDNGTGSTLDSLTMNYDGEQWRNGGNTTPHTMVVEYGFGASFGAVTTWNIAGVGFDFTGPIATATAAALDGNDAANRVAGIGGTISSLNWLAGDRLWIRWAEVNEAGNDHGLGIDNWSFSANLVPSPGAVALLGIAGLTARRRRMA